MAGLSFSVIVFWFPVQARFLDNSCQSTPRFVYRENRLYWGRHCLVTYRALRIPLLPDTRYLNQGEVGNYGRDNARHSLKWQRMRAGFVSPSHHPGQ